MIKINLAPPHDEPAVIPDVPAWLSTWLAAALCLLPFATLVPLYDWPPGVAAGNSPLVLLHLAGLLAIASLICREDPWLAAFAAYIAVDALRAPGPTVGRAWQMADAVALGGLLYVWARRIPDRWAGRIRIAFGVSAILQATTAALQYVGRDPFYRADAPFQTAGTMVGTLGNDTWLGAFLAICGAVAPWWATPFAAVGLLLAYNRLGLIALAVALVVRFILRLDPIDRRYFIGPLAVLTGFLVPSTVFLVMDKTTDTVYTRLYVWRKGLAAWWEHGILFGRGPGVWAWDMRQLELPEFFTQMHNEYLQLLYETGAVGLALIIGWAIARRRELVSNPAAWALAILCAAFFPLHVAQVAGPALIAVAVWPRAES